MKKKITFKQKVDLVNIDKKIDDWVLDGSKVNKIGTLPLKSIIFDEKRFTIVVPTYLHKRIKKASAIKGVSIKNILIDIFEKEFPEL